MKKLIKKIIAIALVCNILALSSCSNNDDDNNTTPKYTFKMNEKISARLDSLLERYGEMYNAMGTFCICKNGETVYSKSLGYSYINGIIKTPATGNTEYRVGSISKMFTAVMIFQLIDEGKLTIDTKLSNFFPQIKNAEKITIGNMMNHSSGIYDFVNDDDSDYNDWNDQYKTADEIIAILSQESSQFEPGTENMYSNSNYVLLGYIIEKLDRTTFAQSLAKRITSKIGLAHTYASDGNISAGEAFGYDFENGQWLERHKENLATVGGAGCVISTMSDIGKFVYELFKGNLTSNTSLKTMTTNFIDGGFDMKYGYGIFKNNVKPDCVLVSYGHTGATDDMDSILDYYPDDGVSFSSCVNGYCEDNLPSYFSDNFVKQKMLNICYGVE